MRCVTVTLVLLLGSLICVPTAPAQTPYTGGLIAPEAARRFGLERSWFTQVRVDPNRGRLEHVRLFISSTAAQTICELATASGVRYRYTDRQLDIYENPIGPQRAEELAKQKQQELAAQGMEVNITTRTVPDMTLLVTTDRGMVHALDAETGKTRWAAPVGNRFYPTFAPTASDKFVAVVNGITVFVLDMSDGQRVLAKRTRGIPSAGAILLEDQVFVPMTSGTVEAWSLGKESQNWPEIYSAVGQVDFQPTVAGNRIAWATEYGDIMVITAGQPGIQFRLETNRPLAGRMGFSAPDRVVAISGSGYVYCFSIADGQILWQSSTGEKTVEGAIIVADQAYIVTKYAGIYALDIGTGVTKWWAPEISQFVAATEQRVYGVGNAGQLVVLDRQTGSLVGRIPTVITDQLFINSQTDRIYVASETGLVQCLHETGAVFPTIHVAYEKPTEQAEGPQPPAAKPAPATVEPVDPFGGGAPAPAAKPEPKPEPPAGAPKTDDNPFG